jgi:CDP-glucose 4,6-dehydratase
VASRWAADAVREELSEMTPEFWKGKRVLLTGHTGFKGSWLSLWLHQCGANITGIALDPQTSPNLFEEASVSSSLQSKIGDIRDLAFVEREVSTAAPEIVLHMAAQAIVRRGYRDPVATYGTNVLGTVHVLDAIRRLTAARAVVIVTSDKCYENREAAAPYREEEALGGSDPYANSKACAELVVLAYRTAYFELQQIGVASARAGNVIGGGDWSEDRLISDLMRGVAAGSPVQIRSPEAIRPWQHVLDALDGYLILAERLYGDPARYAESWNFGPSPDDTTEVRVIADRIVARWGNGARWVSANDGGPPEAHVLTLDASKARTKLGWRPRMSLDTALDWIVDWHRAREQGQDMHQFTLRQIAEYQSLGREA